jgi:hypothetical protein
MKKQEESHLQAKVRVLEQNFPQSPKEEQTLVTL